MILYMGLGRMGLPMAQHALRAGQPVLAYDPAIERRDLFRAAGGMAVDDLIPAYKAATAAAVMVGSEAQVQSIVSDMLAHCQPGTLILIVSTVSPKLMAELGREVGQRGMRIVDAPVCRAEMGAISGSLLAFLSGQATDCREATSLMQPYCSDIAVVGEGLGAAQVAKTVNNMILWACAMANEEGLRLAASWKLDTEALRRALVTSSADNWCLRHWDRIGEMPWSIKDMEIALATAREAKVPVPLGVKVEKLVRKTPVLMHA